MPIEPKMRVGTPRAMIDVMRAKRPQRSSFVVTLGATALLGACGGVANTGPTDGGVDDSGNPLGCPTAAPPRGATCSLPDTETCSYGSSCSPTMYSCNNGAWSVAIGNPPAPTCPTAPPSGACTCLPPNFSCMYPKGVCNGIQQYEQVVCSSGQWTGSISTCNPPPPDAGTFPDASVVDASVDANRTD